MKTNYIIRLYLNKNGHLNPDIFDNKSPKAQVVDMPLLRHQNIGILSNSFKVQILAKGCKEKKRVDK